MSAITMPDALARLDALKPTAVPAAEWFGDTAVLAHVRAWARAQDVNPHAALAVVLARVASNVHPSVVLPRLGSLPYASLNTFAALVGASGDGKSALMDGVDLLMPRPLGDDVARVGVSTGEGLVTTFVSREKPRGEEWQDRRIASQAFAVVDEVATMEAVSARTGNTLDSVLRTMWTGSTLAQSNADPSRRRHLEGHTYRLALVCGIQPGLGNVIIDEQAQIGGMPQRFVFAAVRDPELTETSPVVLDPGPLGLAIHPSIPYEPRYGHGNTSTPRGERFVLPVHESILNELAQEKRRRSLHHEGALDGHWMLAKLRQAALLAIIHGSPQVDRTAWDQAGHVMAHSDTTRAGLLAAAGEASAARSAAAGRHDAIRADAAERARTREVGTRILSVIDTHHRDDHGHACTRRCFTLALSKPQRDLRDLALQELTADGYIAQAEVVASGNPSITFRRVR